nr:DUF4913 domain-containing protein [Rhodococcus sp. BP-316]
MSDEFDLDADMDSACPGDASPTDDRDELRDSHTDDDKAGEAGERADSAARGPYYPNAYRFFADFLAPAYRRKTVDHPAMRWCPSWFLHPEARARVDALWRAWEPPARPGHRDECVVEGPR